ncbi:MAG: hypothetical protein RLN84_00030, partial [Rhodospirillaceae bacterium]
HNNGSIVGYYGTANGGNGGHAVKTDIPLSVANYGVIYAGGGGGVNGSSQTANGATGREGKDDCYTSASSCTANGGSGGRGAGWYGLGLIHNDPVSGQGSSSCQTGNNVCWDSFVAYAYGGNGGNGGAFGADARAGGAAGIAFNAYRLVSFVHAGLWSGRVIDDASPGEDDAPIDPVEDADYLLTISSNVQNYLVSSELTASGWDGVTPTSVKVVVEQDAVVGGSSTSSYAMSFEGLPLGSTAILVNNGDIIGRYGAVSGGTGGHAVTTTVAIKLYNYGRIYSGGGAGLTGATRSATGWSWREGKDDCRRSASHCTAYGGSGGRGAGWYAPGLIFESPVAGQGGSSCTAGNNSCGGHDGRAYAHGGSGTSGGPLGFEADVGGAAGYAFTGFNRIDFVVPGEWGGRVANN